jgi:hypothetical protein
MVFVFRMGDALPLGQVSGLCSSSVFTSFFETWKGPKVLVMNLAG